MGAPSPLSRLCGRFRRTDSGSAMVEFALILPFMLLLYIGMVEGSTLISIDRKVQTVSGAVGDLVARADGEISRTKLDDYVKIAGGIMTPYSDDGLVQFVSQVYVDKDGKATVDWSLRYVGQVAQATGAHAQGSTYALPDEIKALAKEQYVIVTECRDTYTPLFGIVFDKAIPLSRENFYIPRFREKIKLVS